jgi:hypothetical protein
LTVMDGGMVVNPCSSPCALHGMPACLNTWSCAHDPLGRSHTPCHASPSTYQRPGVAPCHPAMQGVSIMSPRAPIVSSKHFAHGSIVSHQSFLECGGILLKNKGVDWCQAQQCRNGPQGHSHYDARYCLCIALIGRLTTQVLRPPNPGSGRPLRQCY